MTVAELIEQLKDLPAQAEIVCSGYGVPLPRLIVHAVNGYEDTAYLSLCTPETAERDRAWVRSQSRPDSEEATTDG